MLQNFLFILCFSFAFFSAHANESNASSTNQIVVIDQEIEVLQKKWHSLRLKSMQEEINSQPLMFSEWAEYATHIKKSEDYEDEAGLIQKKIDILKAKRADLIKETHRQPS